MYKIKKETKKKQIKIFRFKFMKFIFLTSIKQYNLSNCFNFITPLFIQFYLVIKYLYKNYINHFFYSINRRFFYRRNYFIKYKKTVSISR